LRQIVQQFKKWHPNCNPSIEAWRSMAAERPAVLVADRDDIARSTTTAILEHFGFPVFVAAKRDEILEALRDHAEISVVVAEASLAPSPNELSPVRRSVRIVVMNDFDCTQADAFAQADAYVQKPYTAGRLLNAVQTALRIGRSPQSTDRLGKSQGAHG
jgi:CheY-like chemotaxis protein